MKTYELKNKYEQVVEILSDGRYGHIENHQMVNKLWELIYNTHVEAFKAGQESVKK